MKDTEVINSPCAETLKETEDFIMINDTPFSYSISKLAKEDGIKIKLYESKPKTNIYYEYEALTQELTSNIKFLVLCEDLDEMIIALKSAFDEKRAKFIEENHKYYIEFQFEAMGKAKKNKIEFKKFEQKNPIDELKEKIALIQNDYKNLYTEIEELKKIKNKNDLDIKDKIKEILQDKEIRMNLYKEFEQIICSKFNLTKETKKEKTVGESSESNISEFNKKLKNIEEKLDEKNNDLHKIKSRLDNMESITKTEIDFSSQIEKKIQNNQLIKNISESVDLIKKNMNDKNNNNYIEMKIYNPAKDYKKIKIFNKIKHINIYIILKEMT